MDKIKRKYIVKTRSQKDCFEILDNLHCQLRGNDDYICCNIILNQDSEIVGDEVIYAVRVYIYEECKEIPHLIFR